MPPDTAALFQEYLTTRYPEAELSDFAFLASGFESQVYSFRLKTPRLSRENFVLRIFPTEDGAEKLAREAHALPVLRQSGYPVPGLLLLEMDPGILGSPFEVIDQLEGRALWPELAALGPQQAAPLLARLGRLLQQLHKLDWRLFTDKAADYEKNPGTLLTDLLSDFNAAFSACKLQDFTGILDWLEDHRPGIAIRPAVVHNDFQANNVILAPNGRLSVIDWTQCGVSDARLDLAWTLQIMGAFGNPEWGRQILQAYSAEESGPLPDMDYFKVIIHLKLLRGFTFFLFDTETLALKPGAAGETEALVHAARMVQGIRNLTGLDLNTLAGMTKTGQP